MHWVTGGSVWNAAKKQYVKTHIKMALTAEIQTKLLGLKISLNVTYWTFQFENAGLSVFMIFLERFLLVEYDHTCTILCAFIWNACISYGKV